MSRGCDAHETEMAFDLCLQRGVNHKLALHDRHGARKENFRDIQNIEEKEAENLDGGNSALVMGL